MDERMELVARCVAGEEPLSRLCRRFGVSRKTGHKWVARYRELGPQGLSDRSQAPLRHPNATPEEAVSLLVGAKLEHPHWGPRKLLAWLYARRPGVALPAASTVGEILARRGLVIPRKRRRRTDPWTRPFADSRAPNDTWAADFKGWFRTGDGRRCDPLTITDAYSRYAIGCWALPRMRYEGVRPKFERVFREYGLPAAIRVYNGTPFASVALAGLSRLSVWWIKLGIVPERIAPAHPEQNGRHDRFHRTLKAPRSPARPGSRCGHSRGPSTPSL